MRSADAEHGVRAVRTDDLTQAEIAAIRALLWAAFDADDPDEHFTEADWQHALGGMHFLVAVAGRIAGHASVVPRDIRIGDRALRTGYVEAVATAPDQQRRGVGGRLVEAASSYVREHYELGALGTGLRGFYARFGWRPWLGPSWVRAPDGPRRTPDEDGYILVLQTPSTPALNPRDPITCDWRPGDVW